MEQFLFVNLAVSIRVNGMKGVFYAFGFHVPRESTLHPFKEGERQTKVRPCVVQQVLKNTNIIMLTTTRLQQFFRHEG